MFFFHWPEEADRLPETVAAFLQDDHINWSDLEGLLMAVRDLRPDMTVGAFATFLFIARRAHAAEDNPARYLTITDVADHLRMSYPTAARHCDLLSEGVRGKPGLGWVRKAQMADNRSRCVFLTSDGIAALSRIIEATKLIV